MKIKDLEKLDGEKELLVLAGGRLRPVVQICEAKDGKHVLLVGEADAKPRTRYNQDDVGFIVRASAYGIPPEAIAPAIGKTPESVRKKFKSLGIGSKV